MALNNQKRIVNTTTKGNVGNPIKPITDTGNSYMEGNISPTTKIYQDIANNMPSSSGSATGNTVPTSTPTPANENSDIVKAYQESAQRLQAEKGTLDPNDKNYRIEEDTYNSKIESTNELIKAYMQNSKASMSAKANAELAQQKAVNGTAAYLKALGLSGQGIAESTMADVNKNYANAMAGIEAQENENNSNAQNSYLEALKQANSERQSRLDQKDLIEDQRAYEEKREAQKNYYDYLYENALNSSALYNQENGAINIDMLETYKERLESALSEGKISHSDYDLMTEMYQSIADEYDSTLKANGFSLTSDKPQGEELSDKDNETLNGLLYSQGINGREGLKYNYNGKNVIYSNGKWQYESATKNEDGGIKADTATEADFGKFWDTGKANSKQSKYVNAIIQAGKEGKIPNGTLIQFNYGLVSGNKKGVYEFRDGAWYEKKNITTFHSIYNDGTIEKLIGKINY